MREHKFRGKRLDNGEWVCGYYCVSRQEVAMDWNIPTIQERNGFRREVNPSTIGQYTGLKDKNGAEIFEGDILQIKIYNSFISDKVVVSGNAAVEFRDDRFGVQWGREFAGLSGFYNTTFEIIGNAHDNPALLGAGEGGVAE